MTVKLWFSSWFSLDIQGKGNSPILESQNSKSMISDFQIFFVVHEKDGVFGSSSSFLTAFI